MLALEEEGATGSRLVVPLPDDDPQAGPRPSWHDAERGNPYLSDGALWLIEGLGCHLGMLTMRTSGRLDRRCVRVSAARYGHGDVGIDDLVP